MVRDSLCSAKSDSLQITLNPPIAAVLLGADSISTCIGTAITLSADLAPNMTYHWLNAGALIPFASAATYETSVAGTYAVQFNDGLCSQVSNEVTLLNYPQTPVSLSTFLPVCAHDTAFELSGGLPFGGSYSGFAISNGYFDPSVVSVGFQNVNYSFTDSNQCTTTASTLIEVKAQLPTPFISQNFDQLYSDYPSGNQWFLNGSPIIGANQSSFTPTQNGWYALVVSDPVLCNSDTAFFNFLSLKVDANSESSTFKISPNPSNGNFNIHPAKALSGKISIALYDLLGQQVYVEIKQARQMQHISLDLHNVLPSGIYTIRITDDSAQYESKLVIY